MLASRYAVKRPYPPRRQNYFMIEPIHAISEGGGVQSSVLKLFGQEGAFKNKPDISVFADTTQEPESVYRWREKLLEMSTIPSPSVSKGDLLTGACQTSVSKKTGKPWMKGLIPAFVRNEDGTKGILGRTCTLDYKIEPIRKFYRIYLGDKLSKWRKVHQSALKVIRDWEEACKVARKNKVIPPLRPSEEWRECQENPLVVQWLGISTDESDRAKDSKVPWIRNEFPLLDAGISRSGCVSELKKRGCTAPRSACKFCPFHNDLEWVRLKQEEPEEFEQAAKAEERLQASANGVLNGVPYLHETMIPLREVKFRSSSEKQLNLFSNECEGMCGV